jgi:ubiquinone/menaquinone biosynthesis C-methylase UbiE
MSKFNYYDNIAQIYDQTRWMTDSVAEEIADFIVELTSATPRTSFLEAGVGTGLNVLPFVKRGYPVTGIDISKEMLDQFRQKFAQMPANLQLVHGDASQLPFVDQCFDIVLTIHMIHTVSDWRAFLDEITRVLKPGGFYLNCQWSTPPARKEFESHFRSILSKYENAKQELKRVDTVLQEIDVEEYFHGRGYTSNYFVAKEWVVSNTVDELINFLKLRAYGLCWQVSDEVFNQIMNELEEFCIEHYGSLQKVLSSKAKFEVWAYRRI